MYACKQKVDKTDFFMHLEWGSGNQSTTDAAAE